MGVGGENAASFPVVLARQVPGEHSSASPTYDHAEKDKLGCVG